MNNDTRGPESSPARGLFTPENRARLLEQAIGKPTGTIVDIGGARFDLVPLSTRDGKWLIESIEQVGAIGKAMMNGNASQDALYALVGEKLPQALGIITRTLKASAGVVGAEAEEVFDAWYDATPFVTTLRAAMLGILRANGFSTVADRIEKQLAAVQSGGPTTPATTTTPETPAPQNS